MTSAAGVGSTFTVTIPTVRHSSLATTPVSGGRLSPAGSSGLLSVTVGPRCCEPDAPLLWNTGEFARHTRAPSSARRA